MDVNSKLQLKPGFMLTAEVYNKMVAVFDGYQRTAIRTFNVGKVGLLSGHQNKVSGAFVRDTFEVNIEDLAAVVPSGNVLTISESAVVKIPLLYGEFYYLTVTIGDRQIEYEVEDIPFTRPAYEYAISTYEDMVRDSSFPLVRFVVKDGNFSLDENFMMPCMVMSSESRMREYLQRLSDQLQVLAEHPNLPKGYIQQMIYGYAFNVNVVSLNLIMTSVYSLLYELASSIDCFIMRPNTESPEAILKPDLFDPERWFTWLIGYVGKACEVLDKVVVEEEKIDLESIKQELRAEIYEHIQPDLENMVNNRVDNLSELLQQRIEEALRDYVNGTVMDELHERLRTELDADIRASLYSDLYQALYSVLFVPKEEEDDTFTPLI